MCRAQEPSQWAQCRQPGPSQSQWTPIQFLPSCTPPAPARTCGGWKTVAVSRWWNWCTAAPGCWTAEWKEIYLLAKFSSRNTFHLPTGFIFNPLRSPWLRSWISSHGTGQVTDIFHPLIYLPFQSLTLSQHISELWNKLQSVVQVQLFICLHLSTLPVFYQKFRGNLASALTKSSFKMAYFDFLKICLCYYLSIVQHFHISFQCNFHFYMQQKTSIQPLWDNTYYENQKSALPTRMSGLCNK